MASSEQPSSHSFNIKEFETEMHKRGELEKFLVEELPKEEKLTRMFHVKDEFKAVLEKIHNVKEESKVREHMYHLVNVITQWKEIKINHSTFSPHGISCRYQLKFNLKKMLEAFEQTNSNGSTTTTTDKDADDEEEDFPDNLRECRWSSRYFTQKDHGLAEKKKFMERLMVKKTKEDGMFGAIAIVGIPGVGKTTLCQVMLDYKEVGKHYSFKLWVCLSKQKEEVVVAGAKGPSRKVEILKRMLICLGQDDDVVEAIIKDNRDEGNIHKLIFAIRRQLKGKKYLVVLDDASEADLDFLKNLSDPTPQSSEGGIVYKTMADVFPRDPGGMVVVTARLETVAKDIVGEKNVHQLPLLKSKDDCWEIFKDTVANGGVFPKEDLDLKELITSKCASIPLAAKMMGLIMRNQIKEREKRKQKKDQDLKVQDEQSKQAPPTS